jgi:transcriptional regulator with XRE-family HTH domain
MDLLQEVRTKLAALPPAELKRIAEEVPGVSFSWLSQVARDKYQSEPTYSRLRRVADWLATNPAHLAKASAA